MSSLLFAAARGARIQLQSLLNEGLWQTTDFAPTVQNTAYTGRIHPDDAHLQYGPISTALRDEALAETWGTRWPCADAFVSEYLHELDGSLVHRWLDSAMYLLILAEALADEGL